MPYYLKSKRVDWRTPRDLFEKLNKEFHFTLDPAASHKNHLCARYFTEKDDGLVQHWHGHTVFMNPPYGKKIKDWVYKAYHESIVGATVVCLLPARTDTRWFHACCLKGEIRFLQGRLSFGRGRAPFPSMVVIFRPRR